MKFNLHDHCAMFCDVHHERPCQSPVEGIPERHTSVKRVSSNEEFRPGFDKWATDDASEPYHLPERLVRAVVLEAAAAEHRHRGLSPPRA